ncbi:MAG: NuoM family protein [Candidatus Bathyarchaeia archaeon]
MPIPFALLQIILVPVVSAPFVYLVGKRIGKQVGWLTFLPLLYTTTLIIMVGWDVLRVGAISEEYAWAPVTALTFGFLADGLSIPIVLTVSLLCCIDAVYSIRYMEHRVLEMYHEDNYQAHAVYYFLYLLYAVGMMGTVLATNLIQFYLFFELMLVPSWALINSYGYGEKERIGMMYFLWTHVGAIAVLAGILTTFTQTGSFAIADMSLLLGNPVVVWVAAAIFLGLFVKMAVFGLHIWLPYAHAEAPTPISALLSPAMIGIGAYAAARIVIVPLHDVVVTLSPLIAVWALITMIYGGLMALAQDDIKRLLAYSSISQMGYLQLGLSSMTALGVTGSMFHYVSHGTGKFILFSVAGVLICQVGIRSIRRLGGLASKMPITSTVFLLGFLAIAGVPPLNGFQSEWLLFSGYFAKALAGSPSIFELIIAILALIATSITVGYALWTVRRIFFGPLPEHLQDAKEAPLIMTAPLLVSAFVAILLGVYPRWITDFLIPALRSLAI